LLEECSKIDQEGNRWGFSRSLAQRVCATVAWLESKPRSANEKAEQSSSLDHEPRKLKTPCNRTRHAIAS
ncbi:MAG: hypothetical protein ACXW32_13720, partial [Limisphaerales bacterium]